MNGCFFMFQNSKGDIWFTDEKFNKIELPLNPTTIENKENGYILTISI